MNYNTQTEYLFQRSVNFLVQKIDDLSVRFPHHEDDIFVIARNGVVKDIIYKTQCSAHEFLFNLPVTEIAVTARVETLKIWQMQLFLSYYMVKYSTNDRRETLKSKLTEFCNTMNTEASDVDIINLNKINEKRMLEYFGNVENIHLDCSSRILMKIDSECHIWNANERSIIRKIFNECGNGNNFNADFEINGATVNDFPCQIWTTANPKVYKMVYTKYFNILLFIKALKHGAAAANLRSNDGRIACKIKIENETEWISTDIINN